MSKPLGFMVMQRLKLRNIAGMDVFWMLPGTFIVWITKPLHSILDLSSDLTFAQRFLDLPLIVFWIYSSGSTVTQTLDTGM
jgi:hypothetical protein